MARNKYDVDERLESPFNIAHLKRSYVYIKKHAKSMLFALSLNFIAIIVTLLIPTLTQKAMDESVPNKDIQQLLFYSLLIILSTVINTLLVTIRSRIMARVGQQIIYDMRNDLFCKLQELPFTYYDDRPHGKILVRIVQYINNVSDMLSNGIINFVLDIFNLIFIAVFMFMMDYRLSLVIVAGLPILVTVIFIIKPRQRRAWQNQSNKNSNLNAYIQESISGMKVTQIFTREEVNKGIFDRLCLASKKAWMRAVKISNVVWASTDMISAVVGGFVYLVGILWITPTVTFGVLWAMANYSSRFWQPIVSLSNFYNNMINTVAYLERIFETMDEPVEITDKPDAYELPNITGAVEFKDVVFGYMPGQTVLNHVSFSVKPGESIALVGPTGAGKTTVVNLLSRFYNLNSGQILIDGHDIADVTLKSLRRQMGIMLQDSFVFSGTIEDNIRYGKLDATEEEIKAASHTVNADTFIDFMEDGYKTEVKERGSRLSQGQKQLLSFARTIISDPRILILDEATSAIDAKTELLVQEGINQMMKGRTSFVIAHRLSTIRNCDKIMYVSNQNILECGTHDELMAKKGEYYHLYTAQLAEM